MAGRQFLGTHQNRLDSKNRLSIPATFRGVMRTIEAQTIVVRPSLTFPALDAWPDVYFAEYEARLESKDVFSDEHEDLAWDTFSSATELEPDRDGRVILSADLIAFAGLSNEVSVVGLGKKFEIWDRAAATAREQKRAAARAAAMAARA